jgi:hypothetical protein
MSRFKLILLPLLLLGFVLMGTRTATAAPTCTTTCYVDSVNGNDANDGTTAGSALKTIQAAIDQVSAGGEVRVLPGSYNETATNRDVLGAGSYQFGLFFEETAKNGVSVIGVTAADVKITDPNATEAVITTNATNNFGYSGIFVEADDVTIAGLEIGPNIPGENKTIEVIGDNFTLKNSYLNVPDGASPYINDWRYDDVNDISYVESYTIDNNVFSPGGIISIASGAGYSGPVSGRLITNNKFTMDPGQNWPSISFNGDTTTVPWYTYPVGAAIITGNTFTNNAVGGQHIRLRGIADDSAFDWASYWNDNTYNKAVIAGINPPDDVRSFTYNCGAYVCNDTRRIATDIQTEVALAQAGDTVLVAAGTYVETVTIGKSLTLVGDDPATTFIKAPSTIPVASDPNSVIVKVTGAGVSADISKLTITGPGPSGCGSILAGIVVRDGAYANIHDNKVVDIRDTGDSGCQNGIAIFVGRTSWATTGTADITNNEISTYQKGGIVVDNTGSSANIDGNTISGEGAKIAIAENGIQVSRGATAEITNNTVEGHSYTPFTWTSAGILLYQAGTTNTDGNTVSENQIGINTIDTSGTHANNLMTATSAGTGSPGFWGIVVDAPPPTRLPSPMDGDHSAGRESAEALAPKSLAAVQTVVVTGNTITSDGSAGGVGLEADAGFGALDISLTATNNLIHDWDYGVVVFECTSGCSASTFANVDIHRNSIVGNANFGVYSETTTPVVDATCNWWGTADGPGPVGPGSGDPVSADVTFSPWLSSNDLNGLCAEAVFVSTEAPGSVIGGPSFSVEDILKYEVGSDTWTLFFDGSSAGLTNKHNINAMHLGSTVAPNNLYLSFYRNQTNVSGIGTVMGQDIIHYNGSAFSLYFDGSDVALTTFSERIDGLTILDGGSSPIGTGCTAYLLISTSGNGRVTNYPSGTLRFKGEDILGFCMTGSGSTTTGFWHLALDGSVEGMPKNSTYGLWAENTTETYLITKSTFNVDAASGGHSEVYRFDGSAFSGPIFSAPDQGLTKKVDALHIGTAD